jgi:hypothetical protein
MPLSPSPGLFEFDVSHVDTDHTLVRRTGRKIGAKAIIGGNA